MIITINTNIRLDALDYENFKILTVKQQKKKGEAIGELIAAEVKKNKSLLEGKSK